MSQIVFTRARFIPLLLLIVPLLGALISYYLAVRQDHVKPFFPFVSHAAAYPPQSAVFCGLIEITAILGIITSVLRYVVVEQRSFVEHKTLKILNRISLCAGCLAFLGLIYLAVNPVGFPSTDRLDYIWNVTVTHNLGAFGALICFDIYILIQSYLTDHQSKSYNGNAFVHRALAVPILISSITIVLIFRFVVVDFLGRIFDEKTGLFALTNFQYTFYPLTTAVLEWIFAVFVFSFLATFAVDFKHVKVVLRLQPKFEKNNGRMASASHNVSKNIQVAATNGFNAFTQEEKDMKKCQ